MGITSGTAGMVGTAMVCGFGVAGMVGATSVFCTGCAGLAGAGCGTKCGVWQEPAVWLLCHLEQCQQV